MEAPELEPIEFELANGHAVRVQHFVFLDKPTRAQRLDGVASRQYSAICIFSTEDTFPRHFDLFDELRSGAAFDERYEQRIWQWLESLVVTRRHRTYDWVEEFIEDFQEAIARICAEGEDAVEHIARLPELQAQPPDEKDDFDPGDDSNFNDQNDSTGDLPGDRQKPH